MTSSRSLDSERDKVQELAKQYQTQGYSIVWDRKEWPKFLRDLNPDFVALSDQDKVVVEVKVRRKERERLSVHALAEAVGSQPGWRLELVVLEELEIPAVLSFDEVLDLLEEAQEVLEISPLGSFLVTWSAIEALIRTSLEKVGITTREMSPLLMIKTATSQGMIPQDTADLFSNAARVRNSTAHGLAQDEGLVQPRNVLSLIGEARDFLLELERSEVPVSDEASPEEMVEWFFEYYEDPAHTVPYESAEGGYIYYLGGPYDAMDVLWDHFQDAEEKTIEKAVQEISKSGTEWVRKGQYP